MKVIISCGGYATRLYPLTENQPKALLEVKGKPILDHIIEKVEKMKAVDQIFIISNNKFYLKFIDWGVKMQKKCSKKIQIINEHSTMPENQKGAIYGAMIAVNDNKLNDDLLIIYGDNLFSLDLNDYVKFFKKKKGSCIAGYRIEDKESLKKFGIIQKDEDHKIIDIEEKPQEPKSDLAVMGLYIIKKQDLPKLRTFIKRMEKEGKLYPGMSFTYFFKDICKKHKTYVFPFQGEWVDIGSKEDYEKVK